jgi:hypothetical protein
MQQSLATDGLSRLVEAESADKIRHCVRHSGTQSPSGAVSLLTNNKTELKGVDCSAFLTAGDDDGARAIS